MASLPGALEIEVASIWEQILGVEDVAPDEDFFELGGTSLHAARVVTKTRAAFGVKLSVQALVEHPTLAAFAAHVAEQQAAADDASASTGIVPPEGRD